MTRESEPILTSLIGSMSYIDKFHPKGIAVSQPPVLAFREDVSKIYKEGKNFGGIDSEEAAEAWLAPVAAAHIPSSIPTSKYINEAINVFGRKIQLAHKYINVELFPPQLVLWWRKKRSRKPYDFIEMDRLTSKEKANFINVISRKSLQAVELIRRLEGKPTIWGTWGYGTKEEREQEGLTRGGPTVKEGHMHFIYYSPMNNNLSF